MIEKHQVLKEKEKVAGFLKELLTWWVLNEFIRHARGPHGRFGGSSIWYCVGPVLRCYPCCSACGVCCWGAEKF